MRARHQANAMASGWRKASEGIPSHKRVRRVIAAIHHGPCGYLVVCADVFPNGLHDCAEDSCVGWRKGHPHEAYWQPMPTFTPPEGASA